MGLADQAAAAGSSPQQREAPTVEQAIASWRVRPFARGTADCCAFADHVVLAMTGKSYLTFDYNDDDSAESIIDRYGGLSGAVTHSMRRAPVPVDQLRPGDVVLVAILEHEAVGVLMSSRRAAVIFENGSVRAVAAGFIEHGWPAWE